MRDELRRAVMRVLWVMEDEEEKGQRQDAIGRRTTTPPTGNCERRPDLDCNQPWPLLPLLIPLHVPAPRLLLVLVSTGWPPSFPPTALRPRPRVRPFPPAVLSSLHLPCSLVPHDDTRQRFRISLLPSASLTLQGELADGEPPTSQNRNKRCPERNSFPGQIQQT